MSMPSSLKRSYMAIQVVSTIQLLHTVGDCCIRNLFRVKARKEEWFPSRGTPLYRVLLLFGGRATVLTKTNLLPRFTSHRFLLTDTRVPRNTKELVGSVSKQKVEEPGRVGQVLNDIQTVVEKASSVFSGSGGEETLAVRHPLYHSHLHLVSDADMPQTLIDENHTLLDRLRVSHPSLEAVRRITGADPYNLATKLTGAGGGGCAVTLIPEGRCSLSFAPALHQCMHHSSALTIPYPHVPFLCAN